MELEFDKHFQYALDLANNTNQSFFLTWKAWTWKSTFVKYFIENTPKKLLLLAPTWIAAINIGWSTIHSFFGFHPWINMNELKDHFMAKDKYEVLKNADCIIIDEVSMLRADLVDIIDAFIQKSLKNYSYFGWKQIIFVWDVYQLPPIVRKEEKEFFSKNYDTYFFFSSEAYKWLNPITIELQKIHRQQDIIFKRVLNRIRNWIQTHKDLMYLNTRVTNKPDTDEFVISLVTTNKIATEINMSNLKNIESEEYVIAAEVTGEVPEWYYANDKIIRFKIWSQIMMVKNWENRQNGTLGKLTYFDEATKTSSVEINWVEYQIPFSEWNIRKPRYDKQQNVIVNEIVWTFRQVPFKLAWGITIHKSQWMTFDNIFLDFWDKLFASWQWYVAISRVTSMKWLFMKRPLRKSDIFLDSWIIEFIGKSLLDQKVRLLEDFILQWKTIRFYYLKRGVFTEFIDYKIISIEEKIFEWKNYFGVDLESSKSKNIQTFAIQNMYEIEECNN